MQIRDPTEAENDSMLDNLWYERKDGSSLDRKLHDPQFYKELIASFKKTETMEQCRVNATVFLMAARAVDAQADMVSPTFVGTAGSNGTRC